jgi:hypothetical protein
MAAMHKVYNKNIKGFSVQITQKRGGMKLWRFISLFVLLLLTACGTFQVGIEQGGVGSKTRLPVESPLPSTTVTRPLPTAPLLPTTEAASEPSPTILRPPASETPPQPSAATLAPPVTETTSVLNPTPQTVQIFLIALEDNGQSGDLVGCGDSAVPVKVQIPATKGVLKAALEELFSLKGRTYGESGLYNALYQSELRVDRVSIDAQGKAQVYLTGTLTLGGECDDPRVEAQINQTALQFSTVKEVSVFVNGQALQDALSLK